MKTIYEHSIGGDGAKAGAYVDGADLMIAARMPIEKIISPATKALDSALDKLEKLIPGDWDKPYIETIKKEYKEELVKLLGE